MGFLDNVFNNINKPIFLKETSDLNNKLNDLLELKNKGITNGEIDKEILFTKLGIQGEEEIKYELSHADFPMYVLRDIVLEIDDLKAQIDYIVITQARIYYIECKNLIGNITINDRGEASREYILNNKKIKEGMYSPIRQAERHLDVVHKIWSLKNTGLLSGLREKNYYKWNIPLVVCSNSKNMLNTKYCPKDLKNKIIKSDGLLRYLRDDLNHTSRDDLMSQNTMRKWAEKFIELSTNKEINDTKINVFEENNDNNDLIISDEELKERLVEFRKNRSKELGIPAYYIFTNQELDQILVLRPTSIDDFIEYKILSPIKIKSHGKEILEIINKK